MELVSIYQIIETYIKFNYETFIGVYWQIKRIQVSDDEIEKNDKFDNMIRAIKSREALPKYSVVLWEVLRIMCYVYSVYNK